MLLILTGGSLAVAYRSVLCQLQAYAILVVSTAAFVMAINDASLRNECTGKSVKSPYCIECKLESRAVITIGRYLPRISSNYERFYMRPLRVHIGICAWIAWIAYGSLFHEARHNDTEDAYIARMIASLTEDVSGATVLHTLRLCRNFLLFANALYSIFSENSTAGDPGGRTHSSMVWSTRSTILFFLLLFVPTSESTAQALGTLELLGRTGLFAALFVSTEALTRAQQYRFWVGSYVSASQIQLVGLLMALGVVKRRRPGKNCTAETIQVAVADEPPIVGSRFSLDGTLAKGAVIVRCAWLLVSSNAGLVLGLVQLFVTLVLYCRARSDTLTKARARGTLLRVVGDKYQQVPSPSRPPKPSSPRPVVDPVPASVPVAPRPAPVAVRQKPTTSAPLSLGLAMSPDSDFMPGIDADEVDSLFDDQDERNTLEDTQRAKRGKKPRTPSPPQSSEISKRPSAGRNAIARSASPSHRSLATSSDAQVRPPPAQAVSRNDQLGFARI